MNTSCESFDDVADIHARILILGSMPGVESLRRQQYYAHPRNIFWNIIETLFGISRALPYTQRLDDLQTRHIALWDVAYRCERQGSLDQNIKISSVICNDFNRFFAEHIAIQAIFFNGQKAAALYRKQVHSTLDSPYQNLHCQTLPSTSPAHAAMRPEEKFSRWKSALRQQRVMTKL